MIDPAIIKLARTETNKVPLKDTEPYTVTRFIHDKKQILNNCKDSKWKRKVQDLSFSGNNNWDSTPVTIKQIIKKMDSYSVSNSVNIEQLANDVKNSVRTDRQKEFSRIVNRGENRPNHNTNLFEWTLTEGESVGHYLPDASASDSEFESFFNTSIALANEDAQENNEAGPTTKQKLAFRQDIRNHRRNLEEFKAGFRLDLFGRDHHNNKGGSFQRNNNDNRFRNAGPGPARIPYRAQPFDHCPRHGDVHLFHDCPNRLEIDAAYDKIYYEKYKSLSDSIFDIPKSQNDDKISSADRSDKVPFSLL
ncbi:hypothetical protein HDU76_010269, partial [Blyttiomyces sp. JEL0837]